MPSVCSVQGCGRPVKARGWCNRHYQRWWNHGDPEAILDNTGLAAIRRFILKVDLDGTGGCWLWTGTINPRGYGMFYPGVGMVPAHRWSYEHYIGPIPAGLELDHLCRVRHCVNPSHLEPVTQAENRRRSPLAPERKTHCPYGHPYDETNTYVNPRGSRECRTCNRKAGRAERGRVRKSRGDHARQ